MRSPITVLLAAVTLLGAFTLDARLLAGAPNPEAASAPALASGVYLGWSSSTDSRLLLLGRGCRASAADDAMVSLLLSGTQQRLLVPAHAVTSFDVSLGPFGFTPVVSVDLSGDDSWHFDRAVLRCRSGKEFATSLGTVSVLAVQPTTAAVTLETTAQYASDQLFAELLILNHGAETLWISSVDYAPKGRATGLVGAAAGSYAHLPLWRSLVYDPQLAPLDAATVSPWDAAFQHPDDPRRFLPRSADAINLEVAPGEVAVIYLELTSLRPGRRTEPVLAYPVVEIVTENGTQQLASSEPLFTWSPVR